MIARQARVIPLRDLGRMGAREASQSPLGTQWDRGRLGVVRSPDLMTTNNVTRPGRCEVAVEVPRARRLAA